MSRQSDTDPQEHDTVEAPDGRRRPPAGCICAGCCCARGGAYCRAAGCGPCLDLDTAVTERAA